EQCQTADGHGRSPFIRFVIIIHDLPARFKADVPDKVLHKVTKAVSGYFSQGKNTKLPVRSFIQSVTAGWTENGKRTIFCDRKSTGNSARCHMHGTSYPVSPAVLCLTYIVKHHRAGIRRDQSPFRGPDGYTSGGFVQTLPRC